AQHVVRTDLVELSSAPEKTFASGEIDFASRLAEAKDLTDIARGREPDRQRFAILPVKVDQLPDLHRQSAAGRNAHRPGISAEL
ncbi:hypothetical protein, partial [Rhizobium johnstonii]|uniref:hypothetical protein n=1 Tax=Rhizobium johnstonii TaxID=3019933 RepID=UPI003F957901